MFTNPSVQDFKDYFVRDFPYSTNPNIGVMDSDIARAEFESSLTINQGLYDSQDQYNMGFLLLSAHNLVTNIQTSSQGLGSQYDWMVINKAAGNVSQASQIPQRILDNPEYAALSKTGYGLKYLMMILPLLTGQVFVVCGATLE